MLRMLKNTEQEQTRLSKIVVLLMTRIMRLLLCQVKARLR